MAENNTQKLDEDLEKVAGGWSWFRKTNPNLSSEDKAKIKGMLKEYDKLADEYKRIKKAGDMTSGEYLDRINRILNDKKALENVLYV